MRGKLYRGGSYTVRGCTVGGCTVEVMMNKQKLPRLPDHKQICKVTGTEDFNSYTEQGGFIPHHTPHHPASYAGANSEASLLFKVNIAFRKKERCKLLLLKSVLKVPPHDSQRTRRHTYITFVS